MKKTIPTPLEHLDTVIATAGGQTALMRKLNELGYQIKTIATIGQWRKTQVPAEYVPDLEAHFGATAELLRPDVNWGALRTTAPTD